MIQVCIRAAEGRTFIARVCVLPASPLSRFLKSKDLNDSRPSIMMHHHPCSPTLILIYSRSSPDQRLLLTKMTHHHSGFLDAKRRSIDLYASALRPNFYALRRAPTGPLAPRQARPRTMGGGLGNGHPEARSSITKEKRKERADSEIDPQGPRHCPHGGRAAVGAFVGDIT